MVALLGRVEFCFVEFEGDEVFDVEFDEVDEFLVEFEEEFVGTPVLFFVELEVLFDEEVLLADVLLIIPPVLFTITELLFALFEMSPGLIFYYTDH